MTPCPPHLMFKTPPDVRQDADKMRTIIRAEAADCRVQLYNHSANILEPLAGLPASVLAAIYRAARAD